MYIYISIYIYINKYKQMHEYISEKHYIIYEINVYKYKQHIFLNIYTCMCVYLYIHNKYTHLLCKQTFILHAINHLTVVFTKLKYKKYK